MPTAVKTNSCADLYLYLWAGVMRAGQEVHDEAGEDDEQCGRKQERAESTDHHQPCVILVLAFLAVHANQRSAVVRLDVECPERKQSENYADDGHDGDDAADTERCRQTSNFERHRHGQQSFQRYEYGQPRRQ